jgi:hypothetical protein
VRLRFQIGSDGFLGAPGWSIGELRFEQVVNQPFTVYVHQPWACGAVAVEPGAALPSELGLALAGRNPGVGAASLELALPAAGRVSLAVHDAAGRRVTQLVDHEMPAGRHTLRWDRSSSGEKIRAGVYFARLVAGGHAIVRRVVML